MVAIIFEKDEMDLINIDKEDRAWTKDKLLSSTGLFFLKDVVKITGIDRAQFMRHYKTIKAGGDSPWKVMGLKYFWNTWLVRMLVFAPYFREHHWVRSVAGMDVNHLLSQDGVFLLKDVCGKTPLPLSQIRYRISRNPNAAREYGAWKDEMLNRYLVDMKVFGPWIKQLWKEEQT